ncbi:Hypothetical predicted protein [Mytilus galloprovincialis]|uniref:Uncharacterized protein n=2 Tax=Mytilus galloprovincialis TaxID=29158 RepID=A0A8B6GEZ5_MYTGA|nr:Hypothetical predicted protein [Mytilus galloprovincialis]
MKQMYLYHLSMICNGKSQSTQKNLFYRCNKYQYKHCKDQMCFLLQNVHHDAITGWLMLASMTYREKQYINSVRILDYALSKCTPEKTQFKSRLSDLHQNILRLEVFQKKGIIRSLSILYMGFVKFNKLSNLIPVELEMEVQEVFHVIPSVVYAYFLYFLCYYHSQDVEKCIVVLQNLNLTIHGNVFIPPDDRFKAISYNILGIALLITGDKKSALEAFKQAVELEPNPVYHSAARRAAMLKTT